MSRRIVFVEYKRLDGKYEQIAPRWNNTFDVRFAADHRFIEFQHYGEPNDWTLVALDRVSILTVRDEPD